MRAARCLLAAINLSAQSNPLSPSAEFNLNAALTHSPGRTARTFFGATPNQLTLVTIEENRVSLVSADPDGRILHSRSDLSSVGAQIYEALPCPDGSVWLVAMGPYYLMLPGDAGTGPFAGPALADDFQQLDLYSPAGKHLSSVRLLSGSTWETPIAAAGDLLILRASVFTGLGSDRRTELIRFGTAAGGQFKETAFARLQPPILGAIPVLASNGNLVLIDKTSGNMVVVDPKTGSGSMLRVIHPHPVQAATADAGFLYLLSAGDWTKKWRLDDAEVLKAVEEEEQNVRQQRDPWDASGESVRRAGPALRTPHNAP